MKKPNKKFFIRIRFGSHGQLYSGKGVMVECLKGKNLEEISRGIAFTDIENREKLARDVSLTVYKYFIQEFFGINPKSFVTNQVNEKLRQDYPFKKLFGRLWWRKPIDKGE